MATYLWLPDLPPASPSAEDDEFDGASGGVPGGWTEVDHGSVMTVGEDEAGLTLTETSVAGDSVAGVRKTIPAGDFTYWSKVSISQIALVGAGRAGLALFEDAASSTGDIVTIALLQDTAAAQLVVTRWSAYNVFSSTLLVSAISVDVAPSHLYLRVRRTGTTYSFDFSTGGEHWQRVYNTAALGFVPLHIGLVVNNNATGGAMQARFPFFRYAASDVGIDGLSGGNRMILGGAGAGVLEGLTASGDAESIAATGAPALAQLIADGVGVADIYASAAASLGGLEAAASGAINYSPVNSSIWMPDIAPLGGTASDEFNLNSGGVPAGWTEVDHGAVQTVSEDEAGLVLTHPTHAGDSFAGIYKSLPAGDCSIVMQCSRVGAGLTSTLYHGLALWQDATNPTAPVVFFGLSNNVNDLTLSVHYFFNYTTYFVSPAGPFVLSPDVLWTGFYLRFRRSGGIEYYDFSNDGIGWVNIFTDTTPFSPGHYGPVMSNSGTGATAVLRSKFCRYAATDVGLTGLSQGQRRGVLSAALGEASIWMPDARPPVAGAIDDEFLTVGAGVPSGWTAQADMAATGTVAVDEGGLVLSQVANGHAGPGIYKPIPSGDFTVITKVSLSYPWITSNSVMAGFMLWQDPTDAQGDAYSFSIDDYFPNTTSKIEMWLWSTALSRSNQVGSLSQINPGPGLVGVYLRMRRTGTTYSFDWSSDGVGWMGHHSLTSSILTHFGLFIENECAVDIAARFQFFRYRSSDVGLTGMLEGDRIKVLGA